MAARRKACSINGLTNTRLRLATTVLATWIMILNVSSVQAVQRCYLCGPESKPWVSGEIQDCTQFKTTSEFVADCGSSYEFCATAYDHKNKMESRICVKEMTKGCIVKGTAHGNVLNICSCEGPLCNSGAFNISKLGSEPNDGFPTTTLLTIILETTSEEYTTVTEIEKTDKPASTIKTEENAHIVNEKSNDSETNKVISKAERDLPLGDEKQKDISVTPHALPQPEALGQQHDKKPANQGAPVDDEEDASEGSGSRMESDNKSHHPTTTRITILEPETTTAAKSQGTSFHSSVIVSLAVWTVVGRLIIV